MSAEPRTIERDKAKPLNIYNAINRIMSELPAIGKWRENKQQGFRYRGIDDVCNFLHPLMAKYGVFVVPRVTGTDRMEKTTRNGGVMHYALATVAYTFFASDGSSVECAEVTGEGMDSGDKASSKAMTSAYKTALTQVFMITTEDMVDPDAESPEVKAPDPDERAATDEQWSMITDYREAGEIPEVTLAWLDKQEELTFGQAKTLLQKLKEASKE